MSPRGTQVPDGAIMTVMTQSFQGMLEPASAASFSSQRLRAASSASRWVLRWVADRRTGPLDIMAVVAAMGDGIFQECGSVHQRFPGLSEPEILETVFELYVVACSVVFVQAVPVL